MGNIFASVDCSDDNESIGVEQSNFLVTPKLTHAQIVLLRRAWLHTRVKGHVQIGYDIFQEILSKSPEIGRIFRKNSASIEEYNKRHAIHAGRFGETLEFVIEHLEDLTIIREPLIQLGKDHSHFKGIGFRPKLWNVFAESLIQCTLDWGERRQKCQESQKAWVEIVFYIIDLMKEGYYEELKSMRKK